MLVSCWVYGLTAASKHEIRYVGQTIRPVDVRLSRHIKGCGSGRTAVSRWLRSLRERGEGVKAVVLAPPQFAVWNQTERHLIALYKKFGARLLNLTDGGDGALGYRHTEEHKARMAQRMLGNQYGRGVPRPESFKQAMRKPKSAEHRLKIAAALKGRKLSDAHRKNLSRAKLSRALPKP